LIRDSFSSACGLVFENEPEETLNRGVNSIQLLKLTVILPTLVLGSCTSSRDDGERSPAGQLFVKHCVACHGRNGEGKQVSGQVIPSLKTGRATTDSDDVMRRQIERGGKGMPPFDYQITPEQVNALVLYIRQVQKHKGD